jgi:hypothetical protein
MFMFAVAFVFFIIAPFPIFSIIFDMGLKPYDFDTVRVVAFEVYFFYVFVGSAGAAGISGRGI